MSRAGVTRTALLLRSSGAPIMSKRITQIPFIGGSGRVPTGALQFQDDWPGLFVRGDEAISLKCNIRAMQERLADHPDVVVGMALLKLGAIADIIERDVMVRGERA